MEENNNKRKLALIIGIVFFAVLIVGASFSYFLVTGSNSSTTTAGRTSLNHPGTVSLIQGVSDIYLDTTPEQMLEDYADTDYYGMDDEVSPDTEPQEHVLASIVATGGDNDMVYQCTMTYSMAVSMISGTSSSAYNSLTSDDAEFIIGVIPDDDSGNSALNIAGSYALMQANGHLNITGSSIVRINGNTGLDIIGDLVLHNLDDDQTDIADIGLDLAFDITSFSCDPFEPSVITLAIDSGAIETIDRGDEITISGKGMLASGQEITISGENFYVIDTNDYETTLLAKYNLLVGDVIGAHNIGSRYYYYSYDKTLTPSDPGYGLQSSTATKAGTASEYQTTGVVAFSAAGYWDDGNNNLVSPYNANGASYSGNPKPFVYNSSLSNIAPSLSYGTANSQMAYGYAQNNGYTIAYYVEEYVRELGIVGYGRLLSYEEAQSLLTSNFSIVSTGSGYWLGSVRTRTEAYCFYYSNPYISTQSIGNAGFYGVRPVIVIPTADIEIE